MPRSDPARQARYVRAYHRASAELRRRHLAEWEELRQHFLGNTYDLNRKLPAGPHRGWRPITTDNVIRDLREALDAVWSLVPKRKISELDDDTLAFVRSNREELWAHPREDEDADATTATARRATS